MKAGQLKLLIFFHARPSLEGGVRGPTTRFVQAFDEAGKETDKPNRKMSNPATFKCNVASLSCSFI
jgi:hypothetical protein